MHHSFSSVVVFVVIQTSINGYQLTEQRIVDLLATGVVVVAVYVTLELFRACFSRRASY